MAKDEIKTDNIVDMQAAINDGSPMWILVAGANVSKMPLDEVCSRLEKGFMRIPDAAERKVWDDLAKAEAARAQVAQQGPQG